MSAVYSVCMVLIAVGIIEIVLPSEHCAGTMKLLTGAVAAASLLSVFTSVSIDFDDISVGTEYSDFDYEEYSARAAERVVSGILQANEIKDAKITVETSKSENGGISYNKVTVTAARFTDKRQIEKEISAALNTQAVLTEER